MAMERFRNGQTVVVRNIAHSDGTITSAIPMTVISDDADCLALYLPVGAISQDNYSVPPGDRAEAVGRAQASRQRAYAERRWPRPMIRLYLPKRPYSAHLFFEDDWRFIGWYGNLEAPFQRTPIGIDSQDHALDVLADPQLRWRWKDEDEFARRLELGIDTVTHQAQVRLAGRQFIEALLSGAPPLDRDWPAWRPPSDWAAPRLPALWAADHGTRFRRLEP